jgi:putative SOS response-associated peptidase YedK
MCGRFAQVYDDTKLLNKFRIEDISEKIQPKFNLSPGMKVNAVFSPDRSLMLKPMIWGFSELHGKPLPSLIFNSRLDTILSGSHLGNYLIHHRCIIPVSGFYEWNGKQPYFIKNTEDILCLAGVFVHDEGGLKCSVTTVDSVGFLKNIHHRMPLILNDELVDLWLSKNDPYEASLISDSSRLVELLDFHKVSQTVNDAGFESKVCSEPLKEDSLF